MIGHIEKLAILQQGTPSRGFSGQAPWGVWSPHRDYIFVVKESGDSLDVEQPQRQPNA